MIKSEPLAYRMRPSTLEQVVGQDHVIGPDTPLYKMIQNDHLPSMILFGPPGTGKTSMAYAIAGTTKKDFLQLNATTSGKKDIENAIASARVNRNAIIFIDEIHRFNKSQQDSLLNALEAGVFTLIGATTENPFHSVNNAILSRCSQIKELKLLDSDAIIKVLNIAIKNDIVLGKMKINISKEHLLLIAKTTGDARTALNILEDVVWASDRDEDNIRLVTEEVIQQCIENKGLTHDKGDIYYNLLSSFQKSIRGSDVDASIYYLARLLEGGDLESISRRLLVIAYEDIGLANPELCARILPAIESVDRLGLPEGRIPLSVIIIELCLSPKSNSAYKSLDKAIAIVNNHKSYDVPVHLRDTHYQGAEKLGYGKEYKYPHNFPNGWVNQEYLPKELKKRSFYEPVESGAEQRLFKIYNRLKKLRQNDK